VPIEHPARYETIAAELPDIIRNRLFGEGFLPSDLTVGVYRIDTEIVIGSVREF